MRHVIHIFTGMGTEMNHKHHKVIAVISDFTLNQSVGLTHAISTAKEYGQ